MNEPILCLVCLMLLAWVVVLKAQISELRQKLGLEEPPEKKAARKMAQKGRAKSRPSKPGTGYVKGMRSFSLTK